MEVILLVAVAITVYLISTKKWRSRRPNQRWPLPVGPTTQERQARRDAQRERSLVLPPMPASRVLKGKAWVIDGDTIAINRTKIRLAGIDAPEIDMPWGQKSKSAMIRICKGQIVTAQLDGERSYDRLVGTCYLPDGRDIGAELIKQGLALDLPCFSGGKYRHLEPSGARRKLANGEFGHRSLRWKPKSSAA